MGLQGYPERQRLSILTSSLDSRSLLTNLTWLAVQIFILFYFTWPGAPGVPYEVPIDQSWLLDQIHWSASPPQSNRLISRRRDEVLIVSDSQQAPPTTHWSNSITCQSICSCIKSKLSKPAAGYKRGIRRKLSFISRPWILCCFWQLMVIVQQNQSPFALMWKFLAKFSNDVWLISKP